MREEELEIAIKVVIVSGLWDFSNVLVFFIFGYILQVGNGGVGKSSMIQRYCKGIYTRDYKKTIGVDFLERMIE